MDGVEYSPRGLVELKGFSDPIQVVEVSRSVAAGSGSEMTDLAETPSDEQKRDYQLPIGGFLGSLPSGALVARETELARVLASVDVVAGGAGRLILLAGEPGVGKTRLAQEAALALRNRGFLIGTGRSYEPQQGVAY